MPSQSELYDPIGQAFVEEEDETEQESTGSLKIRYQQEWLHREGKKSKFRRTVRMILCMHGWDNPSHTQAMSLVVIKFHFAVHSSSGRYKSVRVWFTFHNHVDNDKPFSTEDPTEAEPRVVAWAPFAKTTRYNETEAQIKVKKDVTGELGVKGPEIAPIEAKASPKYDREAEYPRKFFDAGKSDLMIEDGTDRPYGVDFFLKPNELQKNGDLDFTVALLVTRNKTKNDEQPHFKACMDTQVEAGKSVDFQQGVRRFFRTFGWKSPEDPDIYFDPLYPESKKPLQFSGEEGEKLAGILERNNVRENMGCLNSDKLATLCPVPGLEPCIPSLLTGNEARHTETSTSLALLGGEKDDC